MFTAHFGISCEKHSQKSQIQETNQTGSSLPWVASHFIIFRTCELWRKKRKIIDSFVKVVCDAPDVNRLFMFIL